MIGYYAHHRGAGHLHRAMAIARELRDDVTILSSSPRPLGWHGGWVHLALDHSPHDRDVAADVSAHGALHWSPLGSPGLRSRMAMIGDWLREAGPSVVVVDVSVEVALLVRLHGIPVVTVAQPGDRTDAAHTLGYRASSAIVAAWPEGAHPTDVAADVASRIEPVGAVSRIPTVDPLPRDPRQIAVLAGLGTRGASALDSAVADARASLPHLRWIELTGADTATVARTLRTSSLVIAHCGGNAIAEIAASRVPAILVPEARPHDEQRAMGRALTAAGMPVTVLDDGDDAFDETTATLDRTTAASTTAADWTRLVRDTAALDGTVWHRWCDGAGAGRAAAVIERVAASVAGLPTGSTPASAA